MCKFSSSVTFLRKLNKQGNEVGKKRHRVKRTGCPARREIREFQDEGEGGPGMAVGRQESTRPGWRRMTMAERFPKKTPKTKN